MRRALFSSVLAFLGVVAFSCGGSDKDGTPGTGDPNGTRDAGGDTGAGDTATSGDDSSSTTADCSKSTVQASDDPVCNTCAKANCCEQVLACEKSFDCKAFSDCVAACPSNDDTCVLTCAAVHQQGADVAQDLGACAAYKCKNECQTPDAAQPNFDF